jgi:uncharacterized protein
MGVFRVSSAVLCLTAAAFLAPAAQAEITYPSKPPEGTFIVDEAHLLTTADRQEINTLSGTLLREQGVPIFVVTIPSLAQYGAGGLAIEAYAMSLFNTWGIGTPQRNYGILLLVSAGDRRARIELGADWSNRKDADAQRIMEGTVIPEFRRGNYSAGMLGGVRALDAMARGQAIPMPKPPWWTVPQAIAVVVGMIALIVSLFRSGRKGWGWALIAALAVLLFFMLRSAAASRGRGGFGGSGFGGGFSGGGGATGSW